MQQSATALAPEGAVQDARARSLSRARSPRRQETKDSEKSGRVWARVPEKDPWAPCILTLDGGGIRGYSSLLILKELMHQVYQWEMRLNEEEAALQDSPEEDVQQGQAAGGANRSVGDNHVPPRSTFATIMPEVELLPCHYFDFMFGTSTGGLIATMLGRLRMTVDEALGMYRTVGNDLFGTRRSRLPLRTKYYAQPSRKPFEIWLQVDVKSTQIAMAKTYIRGMLNRWRRYSNVRYPSTWTSRECVRAAV